MDRLRAMTMTALCALASACSDDVSEPRVDDASVDVVDAVDVAFDSARDARDARVDVIDASVIDVPEERVAPYSESLCNDRSTLDELAAAWVSSPVGLRAAAIGVAARRYPIAVEVFEPLDDAQLAGWFAPAMGFSDVLRAFDVGVREAGRAWDSARSEVVRVYRVRDDMVIAARAIESFPRSEIIALHAAPGRDPYVDSYLTGPAGGVGLDGVISDVVHFTHALAARYCTRDALAQGTRVPSRDDLLTVMYYLELYVMRARTAHPSVYGAMLADEAYRRLLRVAWLRADFWLDVTSRSPELGVRDGEVAVWTYAPASLLEMARLPQ